MSYLWETKRPSQCGFINFFKPKLLIVASNIRLPWWCGKCYSVSSNVSVVSCVTAVQLFLRSLIRKQDPLMHELLLDLNCEKLPIPEIEATSFCFILILEWPEQRDGNKPTFLAFYKVIQIKQIIHHLIISMAMGDRFSTKRSCFYKQLHHSSLCSPVI